jgi:hypothetical protein
MSEAAFNAIWKTSRNEILYRYCDDCIESHKKIFMRRLGDFENNLPFDMLQTVLEDWYIAPSNKLGTNFDLYTTYEDALAQTNKWVFCNYGDPSNIGDPNIGFPRDCGKNGYVGGNWNSIDRNTGLKLRNGRNNFYFAVVTNVSFQPSVSDLV